jgi:hypothetical protein
MTGRPLFIYRLADLKDLPSLAGNSERGTLRVAKPTFQVWLSNDETTVRVVEKDVDSDAWRDVENYPAR